MMKKCSARTINKLFPDSWEMAVIICKDMTAEPSFKRKKKKKQRRKNKTNKNVFIWALQDFFIVPQGEITFAEFQQS